MGWKYALILVEIEDGYEQCELVELYNIDGEPAFCKARIMSPEELAMAAKDAEKDGVNRWFFENGTFEWAYEENIGWSWDWSKNP